MQSAGRGGQAGEAVRAGRGLEGERPFFGFWDETRESRIWFIFEVGRLPAFVVTLKPLTRTH